VGNPSRCLIENDSAGSLASTPIIRPILGPVKRETRSMTGGFSRADDSSPVSDSGVATLKARAVFRGSGWFGQRSTSCPNTALNHCSSGRKRSASLPAERNVASWVEQWIDRVFHEGRAALPESGEFVLGQKRSEEPLDAPAVSEESREIGEQLARDRFSAEFPEDGP
jgi:hypothetical protein